MNKKAKSFVVIMIVIAVLALALRVIIAGIIKRNMIQNESNAQGTLKLVSAALENYAKDHVGSYPNDFSLLVKSQPPYLDRDYPSQPPVKGYDYTCNRIEAGGYSCLASPVKCNLTGRQAYTVTSGGLFVSEECSKKE